MKYGSRLALAHWLLIIVAIVACLAACPFQAKAQSTPIGRILYAPDRWWSSAREHNWQLRTWDDTENKSAGMTGGITWLGGLGLSMVTPLSVHRSREAIAAVYALRAAYGLASGETNRYRAHVKHLMAASAVAFLRIELRF